MNNKSKKNQLKKSPKLRSVGRPTKYKPEYCKKLIKFMKEGYTYELFSTEIGVHVDTLYEWEKVYPEFSEAKRLAVREGQMFWEKVGKLGMMGKIKNFNATVWVFSMKNRFRWRDKQEHTGEDGGPIRIAPAETEEELEREIAESDRFLEKTK